MGKLALLVVAVIVALIWFRIKAGRARERETRPGSGRLPEQMVACAHCGVHLPATEAVRDSSGREFCSGAHLDALAGKR